MGFVRDIHALLFTKPSSGRLMLPSLPSTREPIYPEYIPLEDDHEFPAEEQPLPPVDSPTAESPGYITESDPEEDPEGYEDDETEDGPVDYPMDGGDDGDDEDDDSSRDDARDEDEEDEEDEEEEHLAPADSTTVIPADEHDITVPSPDFPYPLHLRGRAPPAHSPPLPPSSGCLTQIQTLRIASTQALINAVTAALPPPPLPPLPPSLSIPSPVDNKGLYYRVVAASLQRLYLSTIRLPDMRSERVPLLDLPEDDLQETVWYGGGGGYASREALGDLRSISWKPGDTHRKLQTHRDHVTQHQRLFDVIRDMRREYERTLQVELLATGRATEEES
ncbi:hypothetical protein Tco_0228559 [Tanacetum coccineum]